MFPDSLCSLVQHNCNIVDAKYASNFTLCTYLMKMREYCRWDKGYSYSDMLSKEEVGEWVSERELLWDDLEQKSFSAIQIDGELHDPFDTDNINNALLAKGMVYSGGVGVRSVPHFFLGKLDATQSYGDYQVYIASEECARDLGAPPAMTLGENIFIRKESIRRMLWEKLQEWQWHKIENAMSRAFSFYDFKGDLAKALDRMTEVELTSIILHEQGEIKTTKILGEDWKDLLMNINSSRLELMLRGIKDYYADSVSTIPVLLQEKKFASIHFYAANLSAIRKELCPSFLLAYQQWCDTGKIHDLEKWVERSTNHWSQVINEVVLLSGKNTTEQDIEKFIEGNRL